MTTLSRILIPLALIALVTLPLVMANPTADPTADVPDDETRRLIIISPHNEQIRTEFGRAFSSWHQQHYGEPVDVQWRSIGGTSDIVRTLHSAYRKFAEQGEMNPFVGYDIMFGGGDYEFEYKLKRFALEQPGPDGKMVSNPFPLLAPVTAEELEADGLVDLTTVFPEDNIAGKALYDAEGHWWGVVLSSFGIVYNRDVLQELGLPEPQQWTDLTDPRYRNQIGLADPAHSGSVKVTYDAILQRYGFDKGVHTLRRIFANARYFTDSSSKVPLDVSAGEVAAGICIDFYGRYQSQMVGGGERVGFVAPQAATLVSPDPVGILRGAKHRETAVRFVRFLLTPEGQALWSFRKGVEWGPKQFELRRSPVMPSLYAERAEDMVDPADPYEIAVPVPEGTPSYFSVVPVLMHSMCMDVHDELKTAWNAILAVENPQLREPMLERFDALPFTSDELLAARQTWKLDERQEVLDRIRWTKFFAENYEAIVD
jgi:ABC-type thiamine transport system substrate-binding protein